MERNHWITNKELTTLYDVSNSYVHVLNNQYDKHWIKKYKPMNSKMSLLLINVGYLERLQDFRAFVNVESQNLYFELMDDFKKQYRLAKYLSDNTDNSVGAWSEFLQNVLFYVNLKEGTIMKTQVSKQKITFIRKARAYLRNVNEDVFN